MVDVHMGASADVLHHATAAVLVHLRLLVIVFFVGIVVIYNQQQNSICDSISRTSSINSLSSKL